jgi:hypothetical protein
MTRSRAEIRKYLRDFLNGTGGRWDWDDFTSITLDDPRLDNIRQEAATLPDRFPPTQPGHYCSEAGLAELRVLAERLE